MDERQSQINDLVATQVSNILFSYSQGQVDAESALKSIQRVYLPFRLDFGL